MRNVQNGPTGLGTLWGTRLFGRAAVPESSTSSSSSSYGPPLAGVWAATTTIGEEDGVEASVVVPEKM